MPKPPDNDPRAVVVTGVSRGLGRALTQWLVEHGHQVAGVARSVPAIDQLRAQFPAPHRFDVLDVADARATDQWAEDLLRHFGVPDLVVNNAAVINANGPLWRVPVEEFSQVMDVNVKGIFHVTRSLLPAMIESGNGVIANFSSAWGRSVAPEVAPYCASKWAVEGLTQALAQELPEGLAAVPVNPGIINTDMLQSCFGPGANNFPSPEKWAASAGPFLLGLSTRDNGRPVSVPA